MLVKAGEPTSPDESRILVFTPGNIPEQEIAATLAQQLAQQQLLAGSGSEEEPENTSRNFLENLVDEINKSFGVGESIDWGHYQSGKAAKIIRNNLNSENPDPKLLEEINRYRKNYIATALAQARLGQNQPEKFLKTYRPYFDITEITGEIAQRIKAIIKNVIRNHLTANQPEDEDLIKTITNEIINELQTLATDSSDENVEPASQIQQLLKNSDLISNLEQLVREILSDLNLQQINPQEIQQAEQADHKAGLTSLDDKINQLRIVLANPAQYSSTQARNRLWELLDNIFNKLANIDPVPLPIPVSWKLSPLISACIALIKGSGFNENSAAISAIISGFVGIFEGLRDARKILKITTEAQAAGVKLPKPYNIKYEPISAQSLFKEINDLRNNSDPDQPNRQKLLQKIHLIRILWNEYQYPILENNLESNDLEKIQNLARQHGITLEPNQTPLVFYRNLLLLVEVLGIELIQETRQARQSESGLSPNPETFWHQTGLDGLREAVIEKVRKIDQALGFKNHPKFYLLKAFKNAIIPALFGFLFYGISAETWRKLNL
jgi:hypothetical protein